MRTGYYASLTDVWGRQRDLKWHYVSIQGRALTTLSGHLPAVGFTLLFIKGWVFCIEHEGFSVPLHWDLRFLILSFCLRVWSQCAVLKSSFQVSKHLLLFFSLVCGCGCMGVGVGMGVCVIRKCERWLAGAMAGIWKSEDNFGNLFFLL